MLSPDGQWLAYSFMPQDADGDLILREVSTGREHRVPVGALPVPVAGPLEEGANPEAPPPPRNIRIAFTGDNRFAVATTHPAKAELSAARKAKKKPDEMPKGGLVMVKLATGEVTRVANVKSFQVPAKGGSWAAYLKEAKPGDPKPDSADAAEKKAEPDPGDESETPNADATAPRPAGGAATATGTRTYGTELVLRNLEEGSERNFASVTDYSLTRDGGTLLYAVSSRTQGENGIYVATPGDAVEPKAVLSGRGRYSRLSWDREQTQAAFVSDRDTAGSRTPRFKLYHWSRGAKDAKPLVTTETKGVPAGLVVSNNASATFSRDGLKLFVPLATAPKPPRAPGTAPADEERVTADLWHWRDGYIQPMQKTRANLERNRTYRGSLDLASGAYVQLADRTMESVTMSDDGTRTIGYDDRAYRQMVDHDGRFTDIYLVDSKTGERKLALKQLRGEAGSGLQWSPDGKWAGYYQDKQWRVLDTATGVSRSLTANLKVAFHNEEADRPEPPGAYGSAGWLKDSSSFLVYDRFDVWQLFPDERAPRNVTALGRQEFPLRWASSQRGYAARHGVTF